MARQRMIKPEFFDSESLGTCSLGARLAFVGLWVNADDYGNLKAQPSRLRMKIFPYDTMDDRGFLDLLSELEEVGCIKGYSVDGDDYITIPNFGVYQTVNRPSKSSIPTPPKTVLSKRRTRLVGEWARCGKQVDSVSTHGALTLKKERSKEGSIPQRNTSLPTGTSADGAALACATPPACPECGAGMSTTVINEGGVYSKRHRCPECGSEVVA